MTKPTKEEKVRFISEFLDKLVIAEGKMVTLISVEKYGFCFTDKAVTTQEDRFKTCRVSSEKIFPLLKEISDLSAEEKETLEDMKFDVEGFSIDNANWEQLLYLKNANFALPLFFGVDHPNNGETGIDLGFAVNIARVGEYLK